MKAIIMDRHGGLDVLRYGDLPDPVAQAGQVVVDVHAASINGADVKVREGAYVTISTFPYVLVRDFSASFPRSGLALPTSRWVMPYSACWRADAMEPTRKG